MQYKWAAPPDEKSTRERLHPGEDPSLSIPKSSGVPPLLSRDDLDHLFAEGFVVLDGALAPEEARDLACAMDFMEQSDVLSDPDSWKGIRDDAVRSVPHPPLTPTDALHETRTTNTPISRG